MWKYFPIEVLRIVAEFGGIDVRRALGFPPQRLTVPALAIRPWADTVELPLSKGRMYTFSWEPISKQRHVYLLTQLFPPGIFLTNGIGMWKAHFLATIGMEGIETTVYLEA